jgi:hypothetical protein
MNFLIQGLAVGGEGTLSWVVPISRNEEAEVAHRRQLMDKADMT